MSALRSFHLSPPPLHRYSPQSTKPNTLLSTSTAATAAATTATTSLSSEVIVLPDLPWETKEKILTLELMGINTPNVLTLNPSLSSTPISTIHSVISFLLSKSILHKDLPRVIDTCPALLTSDVRTSIAPVLRFLSVDLDVPDPILRRPIIKCPQLLTSSVPDQLKPTLIYLQRLGFKDKFALAYRYPILLALSVEKELKPRLEYISSIGFTREEAIGMVLRCPWLFTYSIKNNFEPKLKYFREEMNGEVEELKEFPQFFAFSLEKTIEPRHRRLLENEVVTPLSLMLEATDEEFERLLMEKT